MWRYIAPVDDMKFVMTDVLNANNSWNQIPAFAETDNQLVGAILDEAARFCDQVLQPINSSGDVQGCRLENGQVITPDGFPEAWRLFVDGGWPALACDPQFGGQGLPQLLNSALFEMLAASNHAWTMYPGIQHGAYETIRTHGSDELKQRYLEDLVSGEVLATMCLSEPQAGSDLSLIRSKAQLINESNGEVLVDGSKIWISGGDQNMTINIAHLVLARLPDAPPGNRGLSLILIPKLLPNGERNGVFIDSLEKKMGIKGSATCAVRFEQARGWIVGQPNCGLSAMFVMMNAARLHVGLQGLGHLEAASQNALRYAHERVQMRAPQRPAERQSEPADPIAMHPAMRRKILRLQSLTQGMRVIAYKVAMMLDEHDAHPDEQHRQQCAVDTAILTPVVKAFMTDLGHSGADDALQVWGGYGFVHEYAIEQTVRDSRIPMIYEGTNEIQAIDLIARKVLADKGRGVSSLLTRLTAELECDKDQSNSDLTAAAITQLEQFQRTTDQVITASADRSAEWPLMIADDFLKAFGYTLLGWAWAKSLCVLDASGLSSQQQQDKRDVLRFGLQWVLQESLPHLDRINRDDLSLPKLAGVEHPT